MATDVHVHMLREAKAEAGRVVWRTRCGRLLHGRTSEAMSPELTAWESRLTCEDCRLPH